MQFSSTSIHPSKISKNRWIEPSNLFQIYLIWSFNCLNKLHSSVLNSFFFKSILRRNHNSVSEAMAPFRSIATSLTAFATSRQQHQCTRGPCTGTCSSRSNFETRTSTNMFHVANSQLNRPKNTHKSFHHHRSHNNASPLYATPTVTAAAALTTSTPLALGLETKAIGYMGLLALQFGLQPSLTRKFTPKSVNRSTVIFTQDMVKFIMAFATLQITGGWSHAIVGWNISTWLTVAGIPAILYCIQNYSTLVAYQNLSPLTFNVLNQTKTLSAALCCFLKRLCSAES